MNERTLVPVLMPLSHATSLTARFPDNLAVVLSMYGAEQAFIANDVASMLGVSVAKTANRHVVGTSRSRRQPCRHVGWNPRVLPVIGEALRIEQ